jgi:hypothetical protein
MANGWRVAAVLALAWVRCAPVEACRPTARVWMLSARPARVAALTVRPGAPRQPPPSPPVAHPVQAPPHTAVGGRRDDDHGRRGAAEPRVATATGQGDACRGRRAVTTGEVDSAAEAASFHEAHAPPAPASLPAGRRA